MDDIRPRLEKALAGTYVFERELGGGGMSRTYLMREVALQRQVVVKVLAPELLAGISVERFRREVLLAAQLQHPHIVPVHTTGEIDGIPYFTMPYVDGDSLRHRLAKGSIGIGEAVSILRDVSRALAYAHARGIVHRDIKPDNVLLSAGTATVTDFGIAKAISAARTDGGGHNETLTQVGTSIGTPAYMAPEQAAGDPDTDHRADIYSFGVMAYEVLAGRPPFVAATPTKLLAAHMAETPRDVIEFRPDCPPALGALVMRCLAKDPDDRPRDAAELTRVLETVTSSGSGAVVPDILRGGPIRIGRALALWAAASAVVILVAWAARTAIGLPDWVLPGAIGVVLAGLPVLLFTAYVQRLTQRAYTATPSRTPAPQGTMATLAMKASPHVSWRRTWMGGAIAIGGFAVLVIGFMVMRALGIGPMASLQSRGAFGDRETLMIADFRSPPSDSTLGATVAEALRTDLAQSSSLTVLTRSVIRDQLVLMKRALDTVVTYELAREIAERESAKAVLDGAISQLGPSYVITARLVSAADGTDLAQFREEATTDDEILVALGRLTKSIRGKVGESLRTVRASRPMERVTTTSLAALRKYVEGNRLHDEAGEAERGIALLREAVALDTAFAMAWRRLGTMLNNTGAERTAQLEAISNAYRFRERLTEMERLLAEGTYFGNGPTPNREKAIAAFVEAARLDSLSMPALNNPAVLLSQMNEFERAESLFRRAINVPQAFGPAYISLMIAQMMNGRSAATLDSTAALYRARLPGSKDLWESSWLAAWARGDLAAADSIARQINTTATTIRQTVQSSLRLSGTAELRGRMSDAERLRLGASQAQHRQQPTAVNRLRVAFDSAYSATRRGDRPRALVLIERGLARAPMAEIPQAERPWEQLRVLGGLLGEPRLVREATVGFDRDLAGLAYDPVGARAGYAAWLAMAERRWRDVVTQSTESEQRFEMARRPAAFLRGLAYQGLGRADSAIASFERFLTIPEATTNLDGRWKADALRHLGELYESTGDRAKAIDYYGQFTALWAGADAELQPQVKVIRERIARLRAETG